jgi:hypothetical protein
LEKIYGLTLYARKAYDLRAEDLSLSSLSFLRLYDAQITAKEAYTRIVKDLEVIIKAYSDKITKIKSRRFLS